MGADSMYILTHYMPLCGLVLLLVPGVAGQLQWEMIHDGNHSAGAPEARREAGLGYNEDGHALVMFGGRIILQNGGNNAIDIIKDDTWIFDIKDRKWREVTSNHKPAPRYSFVSGLSNGYFYVATGQGKNNRLLNDIWRFDLKTEKWEELKAQPKPDFYTKSQQWSWEPRSQLQPAARYGASGGIFHNSSRFYVTHGNTGRRLSDTFTYSVNEAGWFSEYPDQSPYNPSYPHARCLHAGTMMSPNELLIYGGCLSGGSVGGPCPSGDSWMFDGKTKKWTQLPSCATPRNYATLAMLPIINGERRAILYGGDEGGDDLQVLKTVESEPYQVGVFNPDTKEWSLRSTQGEIPEKRASVSMATGKYGIYMFGGSAMTSTRLYNDLYLLRGDAMTAGQAPEEAECHPTFFSLLILHGILMVLGWGFFLQWGAFIARYMTRRKPTWFHLHRLFQVFGLLITIAGFICGVLSVRFDHFKFSHAIVGLVVMILGLLQPVNALVRPHPPKEGEQKSVRRLLWEFVHSSLGRGALLLGLANISLGLFLAVASKLLWALWFAYLGLLLLCYLIAECNRCYSKKEPAVLAARPAGKYILSDKNTNGLFGDKHNGYDNAALESEG